MYNTLRSILRCRPRQHRLMSTTPAGDTTMQAIVVRSFGGPEVLTVESTPLPRPTSTQAIVKLLAVGINPVETYIRTGVYAGGVPALPYTPGHDGAGIICGHGAGFRGPAIGSRVFLSASTSGTYAQYAVAEAHNIHILPEHLSFEQGAAIATPTKTAYWALKKTGAVAGMKVLIHGGSGAVGIACIQLARAWGLTVHATAGSEAGLTLCHANGAHYVFNHSSPTYQAQIQDMTGGVDIILEMAAHINLPADMQLIGHGGTIAVIGNRGPNEFNARGLMTKTATMIGINVNKLTPPQHHEAFAAITAALSSNILRPVVGSRYTLAESAQAHRHVLSQNGGARGKIVVVPW